MSLRALRRSLPGGIMDGVDPFEKRELARRRKLLCQPKRTKP